MQQTAQGYRDAAATGADFTGRQDGQAIYRNTFGGFTGSVTYVSARKANDLDYGYTASLAYAFGFGATVGYWALKFNSEDGLKDQKIGQSQPAMVLLVGSCTLQPCTTCPNRKLQVLNSQSRAMNLLQYIPWPIIGASWWL